MKTVSALSNHGSLELKNTENSILQHIQNESDWLFSHFPALEHESKIVVNINNFNCEPFISNILLRDICNNEHTSR